MKKGILFVVILWCLLFSVVGCKYFGPPQYEKEQQRQTSMMMNEAMRQIGLPNIHNFWQRKLLKMIYEIADDSNVITFSYTFNRFTGKFRYLGRSIGFGIPFSAQYTNPVQIVMDPYGSGGATIPQPDPNGLYMPTSSSATWIILVNEETGGFNLVYMEPVLTVSQEPLPSCIVDGYPKDFWEKYHSGVYSLSPQEIKQGIDKLFKGAK